jgi:hypothetical protein
MRANDVDEIKSTSAFTGISITYSKVEKPMISMWHINISKTMIK